jgi:predicted component of type VI protein secretion system
MAELLGINGELQGKKVLLEKDLTRFGRGAENDVVLQDGSVSGSHCLIRKEDRGYVLLDLDSSNGSRLNEKDVHEALIEHRDMIEIGTVMFRFLEEVVEPEPVVKPAPEPAPIVKQDEPLSLTPAPRRKKDPEKNRKREVVQSKDDDDTKPRRRVNKEQTIRDASLSDSKSPLAQKSWAYTVGAIGCMVALMIAVIVYLNLVMT